MSEGDPPPTVGVCGDVREGGVEQCLSHRPRLAEVPIGSVHGRNLLGQQPIVHLQEGTGGYAELHLVHALLTDAEVGVGAEAERCGAGPHVDGARRHNQAFVGEPVRDQEIQAPVPTLLRRQPAYEGDCILILPGSRQSRPGGPSHQPVDRVASLRLAEGKLMALPGR